MKGLFLFLLVNVNSVYSDPCTTEPVAAGSHIFITKNIPKTKAIDGIIKWTYTMTDGRNTTLTECNINNNPKCRNPYFNSDRYSATIEDNGSGGYRVTLTIRGVHESMDQTTWKWLSGSDDLIGQCDLEVYVRCTSYVSEGSTAIIVKTVHNSKVTDGNLKWTSIDPFGSSIVVTDCSYNNATQCTSPGFGEDLYSSTIEKSAGASYKQTLTIHKVDRLRDQTTWSLYSGQVLIEQCNLDVFSLPSDPVCQDLEVSSNTNTMLWTCTVSNVYPDMKCQFWGTEATPSEYIETQRTTIEGDYPPRTARHNYVCTLNKTYFKPMDDEVYHGLEFTGILFSWTTNIDGTKSIYGSAYKDADDDGPNIVVIGVIVGSVIAVALVIVLCIVLVKARKRRLLKQQQQRDPNPSGDLGLSDYEELSNQHAVPQNMHTGQNPLKGDNRDDDYLAPAPRQYVSKAIQTDRIHGEVSGQVMSHANEGYQSEFTQERKTKVDSIGENAEQENPISVSEDNHQDFQDRDNKRPGYYVNVTNPVERVTATTYQNGAIGELLAKHLGTKADVTEPNDYDYPDECP